MVRNSPANVRHVGSIPKSGRSPEIGNGTHLDFLASKFHEQRSLVGYSPWGYKELDMTDQLGTCTHTHVHTHTYTHTRTHTHNAHVKITVAR